MTNYFPLMSDGRNYSNAEQPFQTDVFLQNKTNINNNWDYRKYLQNNATLIMKLNQQSCIEKSSFPPQNSFLPESYFHSDLKKIYLTREELQNRKVAPIVFKN